MNISKDKIPKGMSYPLKTSMLEKVLTESNISIHVDLLYVLRSHFFEAFYWFPNENIPYDRLYIRIGAVESRFRKKAQEKMEKEVLPQFIEWANPFMVLPVSSPIQLKRPYFYSDFLSGEKVSITKIIIN
ncbi:MAG: hypothetical protein IEMM0008_1145 [bacterium]|nr:MAG: hypothetical protein IEMM0008_1145 [bacterium]